MTEILMKPSMPLAAAFATAHQPASQQEAAHAKQTESTDPTDHSVGSQVFLGRATSSLEARDASKAVDDSECQGTASAAVNAACKAQPSRPDIVYDSQSSQKKPSEMSSISTSETDTVSACSSLQHIISFSTTKRNNLHVLDDTLILGAGTFVLLLHVPTMQQQYLPGRDGGGVAAVSVHPNKQHFLVAEQCRSRAPNIYIYQYPSLNLVQTLCDGTEQAFSCAVFSPDGSMLASVGSSPDYTLTLWDWQAATTLLRCKAFSQEVYSVKFSPYLPGSLITCGTGHIRFWSMATTFTGLKLQGQIGKFGALELSDIAAFVELPDGTVISGCESGALLLWDGGLVKTVILRPGGAPCHKGAVEIMHHDTNTNCLVTGGGDGMLRLWDLGKISDAVAADGTITCMVKPAAEIAVPGGGCVRGLIWGKRGCYVHTDAGLLFQVCLPLNLMDQKGYVLTKLSELHSGPIVGVFTSPSQHVAITATGDGRIRALDYRAQQKHVLQQRQFTSSTTCACTLPVQIDAQQRCVVLGFADGTLRVVRRCSDGWSLLAAVRPHQAKVSHVCVSPDGHRLAATAVDSHVFFFVLSNNSLQPEFSCVLPDKYPTCCCWSPDSTKLLFGFSSGSVAELAVPAAGSTYCTRTFEHAIHSRCYMSKLPQQPDALQQKCTQSADISQLEGHNQQCEHSAAGMQTLSYSDGDGRLGFPVTQVAYIEGNSNTFRLWLGGRAAGQVLQCTWEQDDPLMVIRSSVQSAAVTTMGISWSGKYRLLGSSDGMVAVEQIASSGMEIQERLWRCALHEMRDGCVTAVCMAFDDTCLLTAASDGTLFVLQNPFSSAMSTEVGSVDIRLPTMAEDAALWAEAEDIDSEAPTLEEEKQAAQRSMHTASATSARNQLEAAVAALRVEQAALVAANDANKVWQQVAQPMLNLDTGLEALIEQERRDKLVDAQAQVAYASELGQKRVEKLHNQFMGSLELHHYNVCDISANNCVSSLRKTRLPNQCQAPVFDDESKRLQLQCPQSSTAQHLGPSNDKAYLQHKSFKSTRIQVEGVNLDSSSQVLPGQEPALSRAELWRQAKKQRSAEWAAFLADKPNENFEAPSDVTALAEAAATIGDYKLKSDPGYIHLAGEHLRPLKKARQMIVLMHNISAAKDRYNASVMALEEHRKDLLEQMNDAIRHFSSTQELLGPTGQHVDECAVHTPAIEELRPDQQQGIKSQSEQEQWIGVLKAKQSKFSVSLNTSRCLKLELLVSLKAAEAQLLIMFKELAVLKEVEVHELALEGKHASKAEEQAELASKLFEINQIMDAKLTELEYATSRRSALIAEFEGSLSRQENFRDQLSKVFYRKIKRSRRYTNATADEEDSISEASVDDDDLDLEDTDDEEGGEVCPPGCDPTSYEHIVEMRERRLDEDEAIVDLGKSLEAVKRDKELILRKVKIVEQSLSAIHQSVIELQQDKQARLNQLRTITHVRLHQVWDMDNQQLPRDLSQTLVFNQQDLLCLKRRMQELNVERHALKQHEKELQRQYKQLQSDKGDKLARLAALEGRSREVQLLKFGETIDTSLLDAIGIRNTEADELKQALKHQAHQSAIELSEWDITLAAKKHELLAVTRENTDGLDTITDVSTQQRDLEAKILAIRSSLWSDPYEARRATILEQNKLVSLIHEQATGLEKLRNKIMMLRRKDVVVNM